MKYIDVFEDGEPLSDGFFQQLALLKYDPLGVDLISYLEMKIKKDLQSLIQCPPSDGEAIAQLQARIDANGALRALITVDEHIYDDDEEKDDAD